MNTSLSDQEDRWAEQRRACLEHYLWRVVEWLQIDDLAEKRAAYRRGVAELGELTAQSIAKTVVRIKEAAYEKHKEPAADLQRLTIEEQMAYLRALFRGTKSRL